MKLKPDKRQVTWGIVAFLVIVASIFAYSFLTQLHYFFTAGIRSVLHSLMAVVFGCIIAYILTPFLNFFETKLFIAPLEKRGKNVRTNQKFRKRLRTFSILISIVLFVLLIISLFVLLIPEFIESIQSVVANLPGIYSSVVRFYNEHIAAAVDTEMNQSVTQTIYSVYQGLDSFLENTLLPQMSAIVQSVSKSAVSFVRLTVNFIIGIIVAVYLLNSKEKLCAQFKKLVYALFKENIANEIIGEFRYLHYTFTGFYVGKIIDSIIIGILCYLGTSIIGTPYALLLSILVGITNIFPFFGPYIGMLIGSILILFISPLHALYFFIFIIVLQQIDGNIIGPLILGQTTGISGFSVIFAILFFGGIFGVPGWIIGVPLFAVILHLIRRFERHLLKKKNLSQETEDYTDVAYIENGTYYRHEDADTSKFYNERPLSAFKKVFRFKKASENDKETADTGRNDRSDEA